MARNCYRWAHWKLLFTCACFGALCAAMVFHSLTQIINQDEEQYVTAAYLAQHMRLYADFLYLQPPIYPLILSQFLTLFSSISPFLIARLLSAAFAVGSVIVLYGLAARLSKSALSAFLVAFLFASAPLMLLAFGSARNDIMPIFFGLCGVSFVLFALDLKRKESESQWSFFAAGICMALGVGTKITAAFIPLSAILYIFLRAKNGLLPLILGGAVGSMPILYYAATAFNKFFYCVISFHVSMPTQYYTSLGQAKFLTLPYQAKSMLLIWAGEPSLVVAILIVFFVGFIVSQQGALLHQLKKHLVAEQAFVVLLAITAIPFVLFPDPTLKQYLQPAVPYVLLSCAAVSALALNSLERPQVLLLLAMPVMVIALQVGRFAVEASHHLNRALWTVSKVHDLSVGIAHLVKGGMVATLYPALALDAGSRVYPQFSTGVYFFRSGNFMTPERVLELNGVSPKTLPSVLGAEPPAAVFTGNTPIDAPLSDWARQHCYVETRISIKKKYRPYPEKYWKPHLFVRPLGAPPCGNG